jgi:hypothetical protein
LRCNIRQQIKTTYRLACLDFTPSGQAKMSSLKVKRVRNRGWAHKPKFPSSNLGPATRKGTFQCLFSFNTRRNQDWSLGSRGYKPSQGMIYYIAASETLFSFNILKLPLVVLLMDIIFAPAEIEKSAVVRM